MSELDQSPAGVSLDRTERHAGGRCDLFVRSSVVDGEPKHLLLLRSKFLERVRSDARLLAAATGWSHTWRALLPTSLLSLV